MEPVGLLSASTNFSQGRMEEKGELDHYIGVATTKHCPDNLRELKVPVLTWAVFEAVGPFPDKLQNVWVVSIQNGFHPQTMNKHKDQKFYGMKAKR